jgi:hypothetical protein
VYCFFVEGAVYWIVVYCFFVEGAEVQSINSPLYHRSVGECERAAAASLSEPAGAETAAEECGEEEK